MIPAFPAYLFDVDGTLVDSALDICGAIQGVLANTPAQNVSYEFLKGYIGRHLMDVFRDVLPDYSAEQLGELITEYRRIYPARNHSSTVVYPGVVDGLAQLGGKKATATTKGTPTTQIVLEKFDLLRYFDHVQGTDAFPAKPNPDVLFKAMEGLGARADECLLIGDATSDMEAGRRAGIKVCAVTYGYGRREDLAQWEPEFWIDDLRQLSIH